ncbi:MAG: hypothetical protein JKY34_05450 [Kordiimonadaceae bacterium]|nr:hypothetical protein [Kordiimonadaceae bacterium]
MTEQEAKLRADEHINHIQAALPRGERAGSYEALMKYLNPNHLGPVSAAGVYREIVRFYMGNRCYG